MDSGNYLIIANLIFRLASLLAGVISIYFGYKLFSKSIWGNSGDFEATFNNLKLVLRKGAPGSFFAIVGALIICVTVFKGFAAKTDTEKSNYSKIEKNETSRPEFKKK